VEVYGNVINHRSLIRFHTAWEKVTRIQIDQHVAMMEGDCDDLIAMAPVDLTGERPSPTWSEANTPSSFPCPSSWQRSCLTRP